VRAAIAPAAVPPADAVRAAEVARWLRSVLTPGAALCADSRSVRSGDAFFAYPGAAGDGRHHVAQAIARGAAALVVEAGGAPPETSPGRTVPRVEVEGLKRLAGPIADAYHDAPSARLAVVAVTGTNGKTSCSQWIARGLDDLGRPAAVVGTLGVGRPDALAESPLTTPDALALQGLFAQFAQASVQVAAIEASSIGLHQHRLDGTRIAVAVFTNLTRDHLDYHGTMADYAQAKARLFGWPALRAAVVNLDDAAAATMLAAVAPGAVRIGYRLADGADPARAGTLAGPTADAMVDRHLRAVSIEPVPDGGTRVALDGDWGPGRFDTPLLGRFNVSNLLAVAGAWLALGVPMPVVAQRLAALRPVPGRLQAVAAPAGASATPLAVVDYAHTPDALANALQALRPVAQARRGRLWCVFGAGGDRDPGKRPLMGAAAGRYADRVVITSDNPRSEPPEAIVAAVAAGLTGPAALVEVDRGRAIAAALGAAAPEDIVLIAGKGHEPYQEIAGVRHPFDDAREAAQALRRRAGALEAGHV
jgi:UDP-N-acetylmuramoyl-L-alanyl-D-glutamate--2,6-diaminopimelate ligase